mmetsp:Transcript_88864/g.276060  ORF Transcript_88864/g.276060 Transcript_88864/m.276060 type:complete len:474 (+) Transcript_88864:1-1422(+)
MGRCSVASPPGPAALAPPTAAWPTAVAGVLAAPGLPQAPGLGGCSPLAASLPPGLFRASLQLQAMPRVPGCSCCRPPVPLWLGAPWACPELRVRGDPGEVGRVGEGDIAPALLGVFGTSGLQALFGRPDATGARRLRCGGLNHVFMVAHAGRLAKCTRPRDEHFSEAREAERLRRDAPLLAGDVHAVAPIAAFVCRESTPALGSRTPCEVVVFEHLEGCRSLGELLRMFERTHPTGPLQSTAACAAHQKCGACGHVGPLRSLLAHQSARLSRRFQAMHGRRHGDLKADNVLLDRRGVPKLVDFLSPFCQSCDREEFLGSTDSLHPVVNEMRGAFDHLWHVEARHAEVLAQTPGCMLSPGEAFCNQQLMEALEQLSVLRQSQPLFGPVPSLLRNVGLAPWPAAAAAPSAAVALERAPAHFPGRPRLMVAREAVGSTWPAGGGSGSSTRSASSSSGGSRSSSHSSHGSRHASYRL